MASLQERLRIQAEKMQGTAAPELVGNTVHGRNVLRAKAPPALIDGVPLSEMSQEQMQALGEQARAELAEDAQRDAAGQPRLTDEEIAERQRVEALRARIAQRKTEIVANDPTAKPEDVRSQLLVQDPIEQTGDFNLDNRGKTYLRTFAAPLGGVAVQLEETMPEDFAYDSREALVLQRAAEGIDFRKGLPFMQRLRTAMSSSIPSAKSQAWVRTMQEAIAKVPEGIEPVVYDSALGSVYIATQISEEDVRQGFEKKENIGKFRYVAADEAGVGLGDVADLVNLGEIGGLVGSVLATGGGRVGFMKGAGLAAAGGTAGRLTGEGLAILGDIAASGGEWVPTAQELKDLGFDAAGTELLAAAAGEMLARGAMKSSDAVQKLYAKMTGRTGAFGRPAEISEANYNIATAKEDLERIQTVTGNKDIAVTPGTASRSIEVTELENSRRKNASPARQREYNVQDAVNEKGWRDFVDNVFDGGTPRVLNGRHGIVKQANRAMDDQNVLVAQVERMEGSDVTELAFVPRLDPDGGIKVRVNDNNWQVSGVMIRPELRGMGVGSDLYRAAAAEARANGKSLAGDTRMTSDAEEVWKRLEGEEGFEKLEWNKNVERIEGNDGRMEIRSTDGEPVVKVKELEPLTPKLLQAYLRAEPNALGRMEAAKEFTRFLRRPGRSELGQVLDETSNNALLKQDVKEAILKDYNRKTTNKQGEWTQKGFEEWKEETGHVVEKFFTPEEMVRIRKRGGLTDVVVEGRRKIEMVEATLQKQLNLGDSTVLRNPDKTSLYKQFSKMDPWQRRRAMAMLDRADMGQGIRSLVKEDIRQQVRPVVVAKSNSEQAAGKFRSWIGTNEQLIRDVFPGRAGVNYVNDLKTMSRIVDQKAMKKGLTGVREEANPSYVAFTRVLFGPLNRKQRGITALRRYQTRRMGEKALDIVSDPEKLRFLMEIRRFPISSRVGGQIASRLGLADIWDGDFSDPDFRDQVAQDIAAYQGIMDSE